MDRYKNRSRFAILALLIGMLTGSGAGCSKMRTYRAQDSPLPGFPTILGRRGRAANKSAATLAQQPPTSRSANVAWSGATNQDKPLVALGAPTEEKSPRLASPAPPSPLVKIRSLVQTGRDSMGKVGSYQVAMNRQERVGSTLLPAEDVLLSIRREPKAVRLEWPAGSHKGREVIYDSSKPGALMHINMADSIVPMPRMSLAPDSPMVMKNSRHPINEAGLDAVLDQLEVTLKAHEAAAAPGEKLTYDGAETLAETGRLCHKVTRVTAKGETWVIALDAESGVPCMVKETAANGDLLEKYVFRNFVPNPPSLAEATAFDPDGRWGASKGLFGRMAQGITPASPAVK